MDPRLEALHALRDRVAAEPAPDAAAEARRQALLADIDRQIAGVEEELRIRRDYWEARDAQDAATPATQAAYDQAAQDTQAHDDLMEQLALRYGSPVEWDRMSPQDQAAYTDAYDRVVASIDAYDAQAAEQQQRATQIEALENQWRAINETFPDLFHGQPVMDPCLACLQQQIDAYERTLPNPLVWIKVIDGPADHIEWNDHAPTAGRFLGAQIVNAPRQDELIPLLAAAAGPSVATTDRFGRKVKLRVGFKYRRQEEFFYRVLLNTPYSYSADETGRHAPYRNKPKYEETCYRGYTDATGEAVVEVEIGPGAKQEWQFQAWDRLGNQDISSTLTSWKLLLWGEAPMAGLPGMIKPIPPAIAALDPEATAPLPLLNDYFVRNNVVSFTYAKREIPYQRNVPVPANGYLTTLARGLFAAEYAKYPKCFMTIVDAHGLMESGETLLTLPLLGLALEYSVSETGFWYDGLDPVLSVNLVSVSGRRAIPPFLVRFKDGDTPDRQNHMTVSVDAVLAEAAKPSEIGVPLAIEIRFRRVTGAAAGFAPPGAQMIVWVSGMPMYHRSGPLTTASTIVHEVGHAIGMASFEGSDLDAIVPPEDPKGLAVARSARAGMRRNKLDQAPKLYEARSHVGPHCYEGTTLETDYDTGGKGEEGICAMFGRARHAYVWVGDTPAIRPNAVNFCPNCEKDMMRSDFDLR